MIKIKFYALLFSVILFAASCGDDKSDDPVGCSQTFALEFQDEINGISAAASVYANDPTMENCEGYKASINIYLDAVEQWGDCARFYDQEDEWQESIDQARLDVQALDCM